MSALITGWASKQSTRTLHYHVYGGRRSLYNSKTDTKTFYLLAKTGISLKTSGIIHLVSVERARRIQISMILKWKLLLKLKSPRGPAFTLTGSVIHIHYFQYYSQCTWKLLLAINRECQNFCTFWIFSCSKTPSKPIKFLNNVVIRSEAKHSNVTLQLFGHLPVYCLDQRESISLKWHTQSSLAHTFSFLNTISTSRVMWWYYSKLTEEICLVSTKKRMFAVSVSTCVLSGSFDLHILFLSYLMSLISCNLFEAVIGGLMEAL